ncbi:MAG: NRDE family protein, partial [Puia sp.]
MVSLHLLLSTGNNVHSNLYSGRQSFFFTSSRDEQAGRPLALFPEIYEINGCRVLFPKDPQGGGSWIAVNENGHAGVLLNGAIKVHEPGLSYRKSRGLVLLDLISGPVTRRCF